jgi:hypothetical protein
VNSSQYDVVIVGSGAGGGTVAQGLVPLVEAVGTPALLLRSGLPLPGSLGAASRVIQP